MTFSFKWMEIIPLLLKPFIGLLYSPWMIDDDCKASRGMNDCRETEDSEKARPSATLATTYPTYDLPPVSKPRLLSGKPKCNRLIYGVL
jgi:hypothetical protein